MEEVIENEYLGSGISNETADKINKILFEKAIPLLNEPVKLKALLNKLKNWLKDNYEVKVDVTTLNKQLIKIYQKDKEEKKVDWNEVLKTNKEKCEEILKQINESIFPIKEVIEQDRLLQNLSENTGIKLTSLRQQLKQIQKNERDKIKDELKNKSKIEKEETLKKAEEKAQELFNKELQAKNFLKKQPYLYDKNKIWWLWNNETYKWVQVDEVDILLMLSNSTGISVIDIRQRQEYINQMKSSGRLNCNKIKPTKETWIQFNDIIVDFLTGEKFNATPDYFITNPIPWKLGKSEDTPTIDKLFREWVVFDGIQDESYVDTLYEVICYTIAVKQFLQRIICLVGGGSNGKTTYTQLIEKFVGENNISSTEMELLKERFESSRFYKKLVLFIGEIDKDIFKKTSIIKRICGEDLMRIEFKGKNGFDAHIPAKPFICCNKLPETTDKSMGFYRRWLIIDFLHKFEKQQNIIKTIPNVEFENLALKSIRILKELWERGSFTNEGSFEERAKKYEDRANPLDSFIENKCFYNGNEKISFDEFFNIFNEWLKANNYRTQTRRELGISIQNREPRIKKRQVKINRTDGTKTTQMYIKGINWKEQEVEKLEEEEQEV